MSIETLKSRREDLIQSIDLHEQIKSDFIGLNTTYKDVYGNETKRVYLDSTASTLMMGPAYRASQKFLKHYANTHSLMHFSAKIATKTYGWVHERVLDFVKANPDEYTCFFAGSGVTAGMNRIARVFNNFRPTRDVVLVSIMEHHSNDLPHRKHGGEVIHIPVDTKTSNMGKVDMDQLEEYLVKYQDRINYVSITGISNVTGIINPINEIAQLTHKYGAYIIVDAAQLAAHVPIQMSGFRDSTKNIDALLFSGHKTYAPGSPGVVVVKKSIMETMSPDEVGGGMVDRVFPEKYFVSNTFPDREEAGTPNILGAVTLGAAIEVLDQIGMDNILKEDMEITNYTLEEMLKIKDVVIYGDSNATICPRAGTISFNINGMNHGLVAAILNDYYNIAVRNECFCAHPYVEKMLELTHTEEISRVKSQNNDVWNIEPWMGMVRASFGVYTTMEDIEKFINALNEIVMNKNQFFDSYKMNKTGDYVHKDFDFSCKEYFTLSETVIDEIKNSPK